MRWPSLTYEDCPWERNADDLLLVPKSRRRIITATYQAAVTPSIAECEVVLPSDLAIRLEDLAVSLARFDALQHARGFELPALLLRSESSASSQIENLTSSVRNVVLAEIAEAVPANARLIAGNVSAMRQALGGSAEFSIESIQAIHACLMGEGNPDAGRLRQEQVWIGGTPYSPHGALFVPPTHERINPALDDLVAFASRSDINPIAQAAISHAQFETIHPFVDGNGRTGRALVHLQLAASGVLASSTLPLSAGLLHNLSDYFAALEAYHEGDALPIVSVFADAFELALELGISSSGRIGELITSWQNGITEREGSAIWRLADLLVKQPVVNSAYIAQEVGITDRAARTLLARGCEYGMLEEAGNYKRGKFYQAPALLEILEEISSSVSVRRSRPW